MTDRDRWYGAIPYLPHDARLWARGPGGSLKPNAAKPLGLMLWLLVCLVVIVLVGMLVVAVLG